MRRDVFAAARALTLPTLALVGIAIFAPGRAELALRIYALVLSATAIVLLLLTLRRAYPQETSLQAPAKPAPRRATAPSLTRLELECALGAAGAFDLHYRLVPRLRLLASGLLHARRRVSLEATPDTARAMLGEDSWNLVRPDRAVPEDRLAKGIAPAELGRVVDALEAI